MELKSADYLLVVLADALAPLWRNVGDLESAALRRRLDQIPIDRPIFVTGLARSGTTILLSTLAAARGVVTHRYRDFPFLWAPCWWNRLQDWLPTNQSPVERPHRDGITITKESPEAFEEPLWAHFFPWGHDPQRDQRLDARTQNESFEEFFLTHIRKLLLLRDGQRYLSKGNYNVARIGYLAKLFPDARFIVPIREPLRHVASLVRQHQLFSDYADRDSRVPKYLRAAGHFEFGPQRQPLQLADPPLQDVVAAWQDGDDWAGYALMWAQVYGHVDELRSNESLAGRLRLLRYEDLCREPMRIVRELIAFAELEDVGEPVVAAAASIQQKESSADTIDAHITARVAEVTGDIAARFGYD